jgi:hypothetical protein
LEEKGWTVHDLDQDECPEIWNQKKHSYDDAVSLVRLFIAN